MTWLFFAFGSAFFAGITAILAKIGIQEINSTLATALRTIVVLAFSWLMALVVGSGSDELKLFLIWRFRVKLHVTRLCF